MKRNSLRRTPFAFTLPLFLVYTAMLIIPIAVALALSFTSWNGFVTSPIEFNGIKNYIAMFSDPKLGAAIKVTVKITVIVAVVDNVLGLLFALLLNKPGKLTTSARTILFIPYILSSVAISFIWMAILSSTGILNSFLNAIGLSQWAGNYFGSETSSLTCIIIVEIWRTLGFHMVIYLAALQTVPSDLYEACTVDGGSAWDKFIHVTLPMIIPGVTVSVLMGIINELRIYDIIRVLTGGGPGTSTQSITYSIVQQAYSKNRMGYSSAIAVFLFVAIILISVIWLKVTSKLEVEE